MKTISKFINKEIKKELKYITKHRLISENEEVVPEYPRVLLTVLNSPVIKNLERKHLRFRLQILFVEILLLLL